MKTKIVVLDYDGTLTKPHKLPDSWARIWHKIGCADLNKKYYKEYFGGEISFEEWLKIGLDIFYEHGVNTQMFEEASTNTELVDNLEKFLSFLNQEGVKVYILSGGIGNIIDAKLGELVKYIESVEAIHFEVDEKGFLIGYKNSAVNMEDKSVFVANLLERESLTCGELVFIGNGLNDESVYKTGVKTICFNPNDDAHCDDRTIWKHCIKNCHDICKTLEFID